MPHWYFFFIVSLALIVIVFIVVFVIPQIIGLGSKAQTKVNPPMEEVNETVESHFRSLNIVSSDPPEIKAYKLFRYFDPLFLNEKNGNSIIYNAFTLNLSVNEYTLPVDVLTLNISEGVRNFSKFDTLLQIGTDAQQLPLLPISFSPDATLDFYANDCWSANAANKLTTISTSFWPCQVYYKGTLNKLNGRVKIRVGWYNDSVTSASGRDVVEVVIAICDDPSS